MGKDTEGLTDEDRRNINFRKFKEKYSRFMGRWTKHNSKKKLFDIEHTEIKQTRTSTKFWVVLTNQEVRILENQNSQFEIQINTTNAKAIKTSLNT